MQTRNPTKYLISQFKLSGGRLISPGCWIRFVSGHLHMLPNSWKNLGRDDLLKRIRETCEQGTSMGLLKRKRHISFSGYVYEIKPDKD